jgi:hypothetical protein
MESLLDENYKEQPWYVEIQKQLDHRKSGINVELAEIVEQSQFYSFMLTVKTMI